MAESKCTTLVAAVGGFLLGVVAGKLLGGGFPGCCGYGGRDRDGCCCCEEGQEDCCCCEEGQEDCCCCDDAEEMVPEEQAPAE